ncbi:Origin recognition complex subunit 1 [Zancudomyces culisetae]|uniref:Origin recognition complex subunit 1 n=1 Tax=Zancudomyces culisetae TaxID=1213189 RepID=A0A1R1PFP1_ZANCU|nr:Origin recognition complex subunit 1 [Zancudomyces culisetae]|eukprot:OMH79766.1 Origin recognition complex subunit 1 [Zancudomyces culisetae]
MNLPERMLHHKISSRLGLKRLNFMPYTHDQLAHIVLSRIDNSPVFDRDAVQLCARKISAVSGDARRALEICRRAVEIAEAEYKQSIKTNPTLNPNPNPNPSISPIPNPSPNTNPNTNFNLNLIPNHNPNSNHTFTSSSIATNLDNSDAKEKNESSDTTATSDKPSTGLKPNQTKLVKVTVNTIDQVIREIYAQGYIPIIQNCSAHQKLFFLALRSALRSTGTPEAPILDIYNVHTSMASMYNHTILNLQQFINLTLDLYHLGCIALQGSCSTSIMTGGGNSGNVGGGSASGYSGFSNAGSGNSVTSSMTIGAGYGTVTMTVSQYSLVKLNISDDDVVIALKSDPVFGKSFDG